MVRRDNYSILNYGSMVTAGPRLDAYVGALHAAVHPESIVMDLGAGPGFFSLLACQFGARHVYAVEPDKAIEVAKAAAANNGYADRISFHQGFSTELSLPEGVDILISDLRGVIPLYTGHIPAIVDARSRFLKPEGIQLPRKDRISLALVESAKTYEPFSAPWTTRPFGLDLTCGHPYVINAWQRFEAEPDDFLTQPLLWAEIDYRAVVDPNVSGRVSGAVERPGTAHGLAIWFDAEIGEGFGYSNAPGQPVLVYGQAFFPLKHPVFVEKGDTFEVALRADLIDGDYVWTWATKIAGQRSQDIKANYRQSTFYAQPAEPEKLRRREAQFVPEVTPTLELQRMCLSLVDGKRPLETIARELASAYPNRYKSWTKALTDVIKIVEGT